MAKLLMSDIEQIQQLLSDGISLRAIAAQFSVSYQTIYNIKRGKFSPAHHQGKAYQLPRRLTPPDPSGDATNYEREMRTSGESAMRKAARKWRRFHPSPLPSDVAAASMEAATSYLVEHPELYRRSATATAQEVRDLHEQWLNLLRDWFRSTIPTRTRGISRTIKNRKKGSKR